MGKKRIPVDKKQFEALKNELERVSGIDLSSDNAYYDLCDYIKTSNPQLSSSASFLRLNVLSSLN